MNGIFVENKQVLRRFLRIKQNYLLHKYTKSIYSVVFLAFVGLTLYGRNVFVLYRVTDGSRAV